ncbi:MAG: adenylate/guanylate cyclase domain-containing protein [Chloroflexota bacterium]|nr:adenylate/guanylate cyclase domain-containing protein [Chloroflexota bacterium]
MSADGTQHEASTPAVTFGATVTILFSDIRGFTEFTDAHGDEAAYRMLQQHNAVLGEQIALYGGHVVKTQGDSYMVSFDSARMALSCAVAMQQAIAKLAPQEGTSISIGVGINTGEPVRDAGDFFGNTVNLASRICGVAGPGEVLLSEGTRHVVGRIGEAEYVDRGLVELKGFQQPQHLYEVAWSGRRVAAHQPRQATAGLDSAPPGGRPSPAGERPAATSRASSSLKLSWPLHGGIAAVLVVASVVALVLARSERQATPRPSNQAVRSAIPATSSPAATAPVESAAGAAVAAPTVAPQPSASAAAAAALPAHGPLLFDLKTAPAGAGLHVDGGNTAADHVRFMDGEVQFDISPHSWAGFDINALGGSDDYVAAIRLQGSNAAGGYSLNFREGPTGAYHVQVNWPGGAAPGRIAILAGAPPNPRQLFGPVPRIPPPVNGEAMLAVTAHGPDITVYAEGSRIAEVRDSSFAKGGVGFSVNSSPTRGFALRLKDLSIYGPSLG